MTDKVRNSAASGNAREELLVSGGTGIGRGDAHERELKVLSGELAALDHDIARTRASLRTSPYARAAHSETDLSRASLRGERVSLRGGTVALIRPIEPSDASQLEAGLEHLSALSRYRRFRAPVDYLSSG